MSALPMLKNGRHPATLSCHPAVLIAVAVCAINDHILKGSGLLPGAITGKLSDVAGLFYFPVLVAVLLLLTFAFFERISPSLRRFRRLTDPATYTDIAVILTVAGFTAVNVIEPANAFAERHWGVFTMDPTDLFCLPMVLVARYFMLSRWRRPEARSPEPHSETASIRRLRWPHYAAVIFAAVVSIATPATPPTISNFPHWSVNDPFIHCWHDVEITPWFAKSGKTGTGVALRFRDTTGEPRQVAVERASFIAFRDEDSPDNTTIRIDAEPPDPITVDGVEGVYIPFEFDNELAWNDGLHRGRVHVTLRIDDRPVRLRFHATHRSASWSDQYPHHQVDMAWFIPSYEPWGAVEELESELSPDEIDESRVEEDERAADDDQQEDDSPRQLRTGYHRVREDEFLIRAPGQTDEVRVRLGEELPGGCLGGPDD